jgi:hypothetical protein
MTYINNFFRNILLVLISIFFTVAIVEFILRVFDLPPYTDHLPVGIYEKDDQTGFRFKPNTKNYQSAYEYKVNIEINSIGLRDHKYFDETIAPHVFAIGDSFTEGGHGLVLEKTIPKVLENKLGKNVINLGIGGIGTREEMFLYEKYLNKFTTKPKISLLFFYVGNDLYDNGQSENGAVGTVVDGYRIPKAYEADKIKVNGNTVSLLNKNGDIIVKQTDNEYHPRFTIGLPFIEQTKIYNIIINLLPLSGKRSCAIPISIPDLFDKNFDWNKSIELRETKKWILKFRNLSLEFGVMPLVVIIPAKYQVIPELLIDLPECGASNNINTDGSINVVKEYLDEIGIKYIDISQEIRKNILDVDRKELYFVSDSHLTPVGAEFVANKVYNKIKDVFPK